MTDEELIAQLLSAITFKDLRLCPIAADRIDAQAAEIKRLRGDLAKAQGALHQIAGKKDYADDPWDIARTTLAKLTGGKDE